MFMKSVRGILWILKQHMLYYRLWVTRVFFLLPVALKGCQMSTEPPSFKCVFCLLSTQYTNVKFHCMYEYSWMYSRRLLNDWKAKLNCEIGPAAESTQFDHSACECLCEGQWIHLTYKVCSICLMTYHKSGQLAIKNIMHDDALKKCVY